MGTASALHLGSARRLAALAAIGVCALVATTGPASAGGTASPAHKQAGKTDDAALLLGDRVLRLQERRRHRCPAPAAEARGRRAARDHRERLQRDAQEPLQEDHGDEPHGLRFTSAKPEPSCDGQSAVGGNQLLLFRTPAGSGTVVVGGSGRYLGATGKATATQIGKSNNSDVVVTVQLAK